MIDILKKILNALKKNFRISAPDYPSQYNIIQDQLSSLKEKEIRIQNLFNKLKEYRVHLNNLRLENELKSIEIDKQLNAFNNDKNKVQQLSEELRKELSILEKENNDLKEQIKGKDFIIDKLDIDKRTKESKIASLENEIVALKNAFRQLVEENRKSVNKFTGLQQEISNDYYDDLVDKNFNNRISDNNQPEEIDRDSQTESSSSEGIDLENDFNESNDNLGMTEEVNYQTEPSTKVNENYLNKKDRQGTFIPPVKRTGGQRSEEDRKGNHLNRTKKIDYESRPRIICFKDERIWKLGLEFSEDEDTSEIEVFQEDCGLNRNRANNNIFELKFITGGIEIRFNSKDYGDVDFGSKKFLVFKLNGENLNKGILVDKTSSGNYIAIVKKIWKYDEVKSGKQISEAEETIDIEYKAQFIFIENGSEQKIGFTDEFGSDVSLKSSKVFYSLSGNKVIDSVEKVGPLFIRELPEIEILDNHYETILHSIVIGDEGIDRENWKKEILLNQGQRIIKLGQEVPNISGGWYFIRFYNKEFTLLDSCDFRFIPEIKEVEIHNLTYVPEICGYGPIKIEIKYKDKLDINIDDDNSSKVTLKKNEEIINIHIEPDPTIGRICIQTKNSSDKIVNLYFIIPWVWWAISDNDVQIWQDQIISVSANDLLDINKYFYFKLPSKGWLKKLVFGLDGTTHREINIHANQDVVKIPLMDYSTFDIKNNLGEFEFICLIDFDNRNYKFVPFVLEISISCSYCSKFKTFNLGEYINHLSIEHSNELFQEPRYEDIQPLLPDLPVRIYECTHCPEDNAFIQAFSHNPVEELIRHIEHDHPGLEKTIKVVSKIEDIEKILSLKLPTYKKCKLCIPMKLIPEEDINNHLLLEHRANILSLTI